MKHVVFGMVLAVLAVICPAADAALITVGTLAPDVVNTQLSGISIRYAVYDSGAPGDTDWTGDANVDGDVVNWTGADGRYLYLYQLVVDTSANPTLEQSIIGVTIFNVNTLASRGFSDAVFSGDNTGTFAPNSGALGPSGTVYAGTNFSGTFDGVYPGGVGFSNVFGYTSTNSPQLTGRGSVFFVSTPTTATQTPANSLPVPGPSTAPPVPEPGTLLMSALALVGGFALRRRLVVA